MNIAAFFLKQQELIAFILLVILLITFAVQLFYYLFFYLRLVFYKKPLLQSTAEPVSVIICARNESKNLTKHLPAILSQDYPNYQVVVVNDCSFDDSEVILEKFEAQYPKLKVVTIHEQEKYEHGKKFALTLGIKAAVHELLLLTDADCV